GGRQRVLQQRQQRHGRQFVGNRPDQQEKQHSRWRCGQLLGGAVVCHHAGAQQLGRPPPRQVAIRRHQRRIRARRVQSPAQHHRDRRGFLLLFGGGEQGQAINRCRCRVLPLGQTFGRQ